jgi:hypothetical protein
MLHLVGNISKGRQVDSYRRFGQLMSSAAGGFLDLERLAFLGALKSNTVIRDIHVSFGFLLL